MTRTEKVLAVGLAISLGLHCVSFAMKSEGEARFGVGEMEETRRFLMHDFELLAGDTARASQSADVALSSAKDAEAQTQALRADVDRAFSDICISGGSCVWR